ncbi:MAG: hypothetical protein MJ249_08625 [Kiritimatiellae bacterium]|nr:hypothetical protein [Kiritimatiellia bacterium]
MMRKNLALFSCAVCVGAVVGAEAPKVEKKTDVSPKAYEGRPQWNNPYVTQENRLPARTLLAPCASEAEARAVAELKQDRLTATYVQSLNGTWKFAWSKDPSVRPVDFYKPGFDVSMWKDLTVPGCWQLSGVYDPVLYSNITYPHAATPSDIMSDPPKNFSSFICRNPVGSYRRSFTTPRAWQDRRVTLRFGGFSSGILVWVNGKKVGYAQDGRLASEFDVTDFLMPAGKPNVLAVEVYRFTDGSFLEDQDFWRFSGLFRDVSLVAEQKDGLRDLTVTTTLSADYKSATLTVAQAVDGATLYDPAGKPVPGAWKNDQLTVAAPRLWSAEKPDLYTLVVNKGGDYFGQAVGFRDVKIENAVLKVNGRRIRIKGTDRHEMSPETGYTVTRADMERDIWLMKSLNLNAVRTSHYPNDPMWYDLCDRLGIYVLCEANIESHGMGYGDKSLAHRADYKAAHIERAVRMIQTHRNHASIIGWSMGNEAGFGENFKAEFKAMKELDTTRPIQYERAPWDAAESEIVCPMYARAAKSEEYVKNNPKKPFILCEYSHAMGNSNGSIQDYWDVVKKYPSAQGGFIWDFVDQAVWSRSFNNPEHGRCGERELDKVAFLAYGGDFGDKPNDDNFNCNGFVDALRNPHPGALEIKHAYRNVMAESFDFATGVLRVHNDFVFTRLTNLKAKWESFAGSQRLGGGDFTVTAEPDTTVEVKLGKVPVAPNAKTYLVVRFFEGVREIACDQFATGSDQPAAATKGACTWQVEESAAFVKVKGAALTAIFNSKMGTLVSLEDAKGQKKIASAVYPEFWRAPIDNDRGNKFDKRCGVWRTAGRKAKCTSFKVEQTQKGGCVVKAVFDVPAGASKAEFTWTFAPGATSVAMSEVFTAAKGQPELPRVGVTFTVPDRFRQVQWAGFGPHENYCDRATSAMYGLWTANVGLERGIAPVNHRTIRFDPNRLNPDNYIEPGEQGHRGGCTSFKIGTLSVRGTDFGFNAWPYAQASLEKAKHMYDLKEEGAVTVVIDAVQMGVGGDNSWGARPHPPYEPAAGKTYRLDLVFD